MENATIDAMIASLPFIFQHVAAFVLFLVIAAAAGTAVAGARLPLALRAIFGLAVAGQTFAVLAACGALRSWVIVAFIVLALATGAVRMDWRSVTSRVAWIAAAAPVLALALYPPLAFDETLYHLPYIRAIANSGAIRVLPAVRFGIFPQLHELLCVPLFLAIGDSATHLVSVAALVLLAALLFIWARPRLAGVVAVALLLGNPIALHLATITYVELALTLFVAAGFYCLDREEFVWAGVLLGTACSVKYLGLYFAAAAFLYLAFTRRDALVRFSLALLAALVPTYAVIIALTGNPLYPFFGKSPWSFPLGGADDRIVSFLRLPWDITFARERMNAQPPYSPFFAIALLLTFVAARRDRRAAFLSIVSVVYAIAFVAVMPQDSRYLLPLLPLITVVAAMILAKRRLLAIVCVVLSMLAALAYLGVRFTRLGPLPRNPAQRQAFLEQRVLEYRALLRRDPGPIYVCGAEDVKYFGGDDMHGDVIGPESNEKVAVDLVGNLSRMGARNVLLGRRCPAEWRALLAPPSFERIYADTSVELWRVSAASR